MLIQWKGRQLDATRVVLRAGVFGGEEIVVALEPNYKDHRRAHPGKTLYALPEIPIVAELRRTNLEALKMVHALKKEFKGWITPKLCEGFCPKVTRKCVDCGRPYTESSTSRCSECEALVKAIGGSK